VNISWRFGVSGDFATASNWSSAAIPGPADDATIAARGTYTVTSSINETVDSLSILDRAATLFITGASSFSTTNGVNDGTIIVDNSALNIGIPSFLFPPAPGSFENSGTLEATDGGSLFFSNETITNTREGVIEANGGAVFVGALTTIVGGTLEGGIRLGAGATSVADAPVLDGTHPGNPVKIEGGAVIAGQDVAKFAGTIDNSGAITMVGGAFPWLVCEGNVTLEGRGDIIMTAGVAPFSSVYLAPAIFGGVLTNIDNTISGAGVIGQIDEGSGLGPAIAPLVGTFINEAKGTIDADASTPLLIAGIGPDTNAGLMEATKGGTLLIDGVTIENSLKHEKGTIQAGQNSAVGLENATIIGGFVKALPGSIIEAEQGSNTITGAHIKNAGIIGAESANLTIVGDVDNHKGNLDANNGTLVVDGVVKGGTATLEGTGRIELGGAYNLYVNDDYGIGNTIIIGNGINDVVSAIGGQYDTITLGNGTGDTVNENYGNFDKISLGDGAGDTVNVNEINPVFAFPPVPNNIITLGDGAGDIVDANNGLADMITLGNGNGDVVNANASTDNIIVLGNGNDDVVNANSPGITPFGNNTITLGNGNGDVVNANTFFGDNIITLGNGNGDVVNGGASIGDGITLGNGNSDTVTLVGAESVGIALGDGNNDKVSVNVGSASAFASITLGNGNGDVVNTDAIDSPIILGNGNGDVVNIGGGGHNTITLGNGNGDVVTSGGGFNTITLGNGNDTVYVGSNDTVTVGTGHDSFVFQQTTPGNVGTVTVTGFNPNKDSFTFSNELTTSVSYHDNAQGNAVVTVDSAGDTITLTGVHAADLHPNDFHFVDPAALPAAPSAAQMVAELHAHTLL
jgi:hypothetical protein